MKFAPLFLVVSIVSLAAACSGEKAAPSTVGVTPATAPNDKAETDPVKRVLNQAPRSRAIQREK